MSKADGYFEAYINQHAYKETPEDAALVRRATDVVRRVIPRSQLQWAGSQRKRTDVVGSDLDLCVESPSPVTEAQRRALRTALEAEFGRQVTFQSHAILIAATATQPRVDIAFANAAFGSRDLPQVDGFKDRRARQAAARALKLWTRGGNLPPIPGWVVEAIVLHLDPTGVEITGLALFRKIVGWLAETATAPVIEGVLKPAASPKWHPVWSARLPGRVEAVRNHARSLLQRSPQPETWRSTEDVGRWLGR